MKIKLLAASSMVASLLLASAGIASADTFSVSCSGAPTTSNITWTAASTGGVAPVAFLWSNGSTSPTQTISYSPGTHSMSLQGTDALPTVSATSTCAATVATPPLQPSISSFTTTPSIILPGGSSVLSWTVSNASSTSLNQGIGVVSSTSVTILPSVTTTYTLSATNPNNTVTAQATVTVGSITPGTGSGIQAKINALLQQIAALHVQLAQLIATRFGGTLENPPFIPPGQIGKIACIELGRSLHHGDRGDDVIKLQVMLKSDPENGFTANPTGLFGPITMKAMVRFQMRMGIVASSSSTDGSVGPLTRGFFNRACGKGLLKHGENSGQSSLSASSSDDDDNERSKSSENKGKGKANATSSEEED